MSHRAEPPVWAPGSGQSQAGDRLSGPGRCAAHHPRQSHHELIKRHRRKSTISRRGRSRKTLSSSQPRRGHGSRPHVMLCLSKGHLPIPVFASIAHTPPQPCFCQIPMLSPAELFFGGCSPSRPSRHHSPSAQVINDSVNEDRSQPAP